MEWITSASAQRPEDIDTESSEVYNYVRKDIEEVEEDGFTSFVYKEAKIQKEDWGLYLDLAQAQADIDYLTMITEGL